MALDAEECADCGCRTARVTRTTTARAAPASVGEKANAELPRRQLGDPAIPSATSRHWHPAYTGRYSSGVFTGSSVGRWAKGVKRDFLSGDLTACSPFHAILFLPGRSPENGADFARPGPAPPETARHRTDSAWYRASPPCRHRRRRGFGAGGRLVGAIGPGAARSVAVSTESAVTATESVATSPHVAAAPPHPSRRRRDRSRHRWDSACPHPIHRGPTGSASASTESVAASTKSVAVSTKPRACRRTMTGPRRKWPRRHGRRRDVVAFRRVATRAGAASGEIQGASLDSVAVSHNRGVAPRRTACRRRIR
jgi:hypothetical protein